MIAVLQEDKNQLNRNVDFSRFLLLYIKLNVHTLPRFYVLLYKDKANVLTITKS